MPSAPNVPIKGKLHEVTFRTEDGLPFVPTRTMTKILKAQMIAASLRYKVRPVDWEYMLNHGHGLVIVDEPADLPRWMAYVKRESSHAVNKLLGRTQRTVWKRGYDPVVILDAEKAIERIVYFYLNPIRAGLVESVDDYPGFTSWVDGFKDQFVLSEDYIPRSAIKALPSPSLTEEEDLKYSEYLEQNSRKQESIEVDCLAWMECFDETRGGDREAMAKRIRDTVYAEEKKLVAERDKPVIGASALKRQSMRKEHTPKKIGRRLLCMGSNPEQRKQVIRWFKSLFAEREELRKQLSPADFMKRIFPGFFRPGNYMLANLNPHFVPF